MEQKGTFKMIDTLQKDKNPMGESEYWNVLMHQSFSHEAKIPTWGKRKRK